jgi:hypothetical protein
MRFSRMRAMVVFPDPDKPVNQMMNPFSVDKWTVLLTAR